jgi:hypothetical protein
MLERLEKLVNDCNESYMLPLYSWIIRHIVSQNNKTINNKVILSFCSKLIKYLQASMVDPDTAELI